ncbi:hypothetical protein ACOL3H_07365 [Aliarcobacter butzleri]
MKKCERLVIFFTKNDSKKIRIYEERFLFNSEKELKDLLSKTVFEDLSEKFYLIFDVKKIPTKTLSRLRLG